MNVLMSKPKRNWSEMKWGRSETKFQNAPDQRQYIEEVEEEEPLPKENRNRRLPERYGNNYTFNTTEEEETVTEPKIYEEALKSTKGKYWKEAMQAEVDSLQHLQTDRKIKMFCLGNGYTKECGANGHVDKYKRGLDFFETYARTCKPETFRTLWAVATQNDLDLGQRGVKSAYPHSAIEEEIYLKQPQGLVKQGENGQTLVCKLTFIYTFIRFIVSKLMY